LVREAALQGCQSRLGGINETLTDEEVRRESAARGGDGKRKEYKGYTTAIELLSLASARPAYAT